MCRFVNTKPNDEFFFFRCCVWQDARVSHEGNSLIIRNIKLEDQGSYICQISTQDQRELRHFIDILGIVSIIDILCVRKSV